MTQINLPHTMDQRLIACNHCGIVALDTPAFNWRRFYDDDGNLAHHCAAAVYAQDLIRQNLVHMHHPDEAIVYENPDRWVAELIGEQDCSLGEPAFDPNDQVPLGAKDYG